MMMMMMVIMMMPAVIIYVTTVVPLPVNGQQKGELLALIAQTWRLKSVLALNAAAESSAHTVSRRRSCHRIQPAPLKLHSS